MLGYLPKTVNLLAHVVSSGNVASNHSAAWCPPNNLELHGSSDNIQNSGPTSIKL